MAGRVCRLVTVPLVLLHLCRFESRVDATEVTAAYSVKEPQKSFQEMDKKGCAIASYYPTFV